MHIPDTFKECLRQLNCRNLNQTYKTRMHQKLDIKPMQDMQPILCTAAPCYIKHVHRFNTHNNVYSDMTDSQVLSVYLVNAESG